jgi:micrococcal nuclease
MRGRAELAALARLAALAVLAALAALAAACDDAGDTTVAPTTMAPAPEDAEPVEVRDVSDGDSFVVERADGNEARVRLLGINAPERDECLADDASAALADLFDRGAVVLERDISDRDSFGRLLRYAYAGETFVNQELVARGLALAGRFPPDVAHQPELDAAEGLAQDARVGVWDPNACGPADSTDVVIVRTEGDPPGPDNVELNGEYVVLANTGDDPVDLTGWTLRDSSSQNRFVFPIGFTIAPDAEVTIRTGPGPDTDDTLQWRLDHPVWDNAGDTAFLVDSNGNVVSFSDLPPSD